MGDGRQPSTLRGDIWLHRYFVNLYRLQSFEISQL
jgi:hypothetical protein